MHLLPGRVLQVAPVTEKDLFSFAGHKRAGALQAGPQADEIGDRHRGRRSPADPRHTTVRTRPDGARSGSLLGDGISRTAKHRPVVGWCFEPRARRYRATTAANTAERFNSTEIQYHRSMAAPNLSELFGQIDIYLFDQLLRGRIRPGMRIVDAGCGAGRNLVYLLRTSATERYGIFGADSDPQAIVSVRRLAASVAPAVPPENFRVEAVEAMSFPEAFADVAISSAVLHFAASDDHFECKLRGTWRVLKPGGLFFCRLASSIGIEHQIRRIEGRRWLLPDGSERYLVDEVMLMELTERLGARLADPLKTTVVQDQRSMTTWVLRKDVYE